MTACVNPGSSGKHVLRSDPQLRLSEYQRAAEYWVSLADPHCERVIMLENSGFDLSSLVDTVTSNPRSRRPFDAFNMGSNDVPDGVHYGFAELSMLDEAAERLPLWNASTLLVKVTGRLVFPSLPSLMNSAGSSVQFLGDARNRNLPARRTSENGALTTQVFAFTPQFYGSHLRDLKGEMTRESNFSSHIETMIYRKAFQARALGSPGVILRFPVQCDPVGYGATHNLHYGHGRDRWKSGVRRVARRVLPWAWV
jgi:hypothetical protein